MDETTDAWEQLSTLLEHFTKEIQVRADIKITGFGCDRAVELQIGEKNRDPLTREQQPWYWTSTGKRNVGTFRELAEAIIEACDFVDASNPDWASIVM